MKSTRRKKAFKVGSGPPSVRDHARLLRAVGLAICRIDSAKKQPTYPGWPTRSLEPEDFDPGDQLGILTGALSSARRPGHSLVGVDLDDVDAVRFADEYLPTTKMVEGRAGKLKSHRYYLVPNSSIPAEEFSTAAQAASAAKKAAGHPGPRTRSFCDPNGEEILRLLGTGSQAVCPPSLHPSGEWRVWCGPNGRPGKPSRVDYRELRAAIEDLAKACGWQPRQTANFKDDGSGISTHSVGLDARLEYRIEMYLAACPPSISGRGGHNQLFKVAVALLHGFALDETAALAMLNAHYNPFCHPKWTNAELRHKVEDAARAVSEKPRGYLIAGKAGSDEMPEGTPLRIQQAFADAVAGRLARLKRTNRRGAKR